MEIAPESERLEGSVEVDGAYVGGPEAGVWGRQLGRNCLIVLAVELQGDAVGRIRKRHIPDASGPSLGGFVHDSVELGSEVRADGWSGYVGLERAGPRHG